MSERTIIRLPQLLLDYTPIALTSVRLLSNTVTVKAQTLAGKNDERNRANTGHRFPLPAPVPTTAVAPSGLDPALGVMRYADGVLLGTIW